MKFYIKTMLGDSGTQALFLYRVARFFLLHHAGFLADVIHRMSKFLTQIDISPYAIIGRGLMIYHGSGVVIGKNSRLG
ncbi:MAG TPA: serine O-acetyltransferase, partial [bacterium]|nr:serine O-acetyltransferase [bacterium]